MPANKTSKLIEDTTPPASKGGIIDVLYQRKLWGFCV